MSIEVAPDPLVAANGNPGTAAGSPRDGTNRAQETSEGSTNSSGAEPDETKADAKDAAAEQLARLEEQGKKDDELAYLRSVVDGINADPEILKFVQDRMSGGKQSDPIEEASKMFEAIDKDSETPGAWKNAMAKAMRAAAEAGARQALAEIGGDLGALKKAVNGNMVEQALMERGIDAATIKSPAFRSLAKELKADGMFPVGMKAEVKARVLDSEWKLRTGDRTVNKAERERIDRVKGANHLNGNNPRASAIAPKKFVYDPNDPQLLSKRAAWMEANPGSTSADFVNIRKQAPK